MLQQCNVSNALPNHESSSINNNKPVITKTRSNTRGNHALLRLENMQEMLRLFLKHISKQQLAKTLRITVKSLDQLLLSEKEPPLRLAYKINLPLIRLYCKTAETIS